MYRLGEFYLEEKVQKRPSFGTPEPLRLAMSVPRNSSRKC